MKLCENCMYDCTIDVSILRSSGFLRIWLTQKCEIFNRSLIFEFDYPHTPIRMYHTKGAGPLYGSPVVWDTRMRGQLKYLASQS